MVEIMIGRFGETSSSANSQTPNAKEKDVWQIDFVALLNCMKSLWALFGKQIGRCGMNRTLKAKLCRNVN